jgi:tetratricopeptide (TPR) repeat protein
VSLSRPTTEVEQSASHSAVAERAAEPQPQPEALGTLSVGERIRRLRQERGMSQSELAGGRLTKGFISQIESGRSNPSPESLRFIAERLDVPFAALLPFREISQQQAYLLRAAEAAVAASRADEAVTLLDEVEPLLSGSRLQSWHLRLRGDVALLRGDHDQAIEHGLVAYELIAASLDAQEEATRACNLIGRAHHVAGRLDGALLYFNRAATLAEQKPLSPVLRAMIHANRGTTHLRLGDLSHALEAYEAARRAAEDAEDVKQLAIAHMGLGEAARLRGELPAAIGHAERAITLFERLEIRQLEAQLLHNMGDVFADLGEHAKARSHQERALRAARAMGDRFTAAHVLDRLAVLDLAEGQPALAREQAEEAVDIAQELVIHRLLCVALCTWAESAEALGQPDVADGLLRQARKAAESAAPAERRQVLLREGSLRRSRGDIEAALACFEAAARAVG